MGSGGQLIAAGRGHGGQAILLRPDLSPVPLSSLWRSIIPRRPPGLALPGRPDRLQILVTLGAGPGTSAAALRRAWAQPTVTALIQDADGISYPLPAGVLPADGQRHALVVPLSGPRQGQLPDAAAQPQPHLCPAAVPPGTRGRPERQPQHHSLAVAGRPAARSAGRSATVPPWRRGRAAGSSPNVPTGPPGVFETSRPGRRTARDPAAGVAPPGEPATHVQCRARSIGIDHEQRAPRAREHHRAVAITAQPPSQYVPAIATSGYLAAARLHIGSTVSVPVGGSSVPVRIVASVARFPTVFGRNRALIADLGAVSDVLAAARGRPCR